MLAHKGGSQNKLELWCFAYRCAVAIVFAWAAWQRFHLPQEPITDPDTWDYLCPAVGQLSGSGFVHSGGRNFVYPTFICFPLGIFRDFRAITIAQHILGLAAGGVLLLTWRRLRDFISRPVLNRAVHAWLGLLASATYLFATDPIHFEMQIRPEGICGLLLVLNFFLVLEFVYWRFLRQKERASLAYGLAAVFSAVLLGSVKPSFSLAAVGTLVPILISFFGRGWFRMKLALGIGGVAVMALLILPEYFLGRADRHKEMLAPMMLFAVHADIICDQMGDDVASGDKIPYPREWLNRIQSTLSKEIAKSFVANPMHYSSLTFDPEYLLYEETSIGPQLSGEFHGNIPELCAFYRFSYWRALRYQPQRILQKIARQMSLFYGTRCGGFDLSKFLRLQMDYTHSAKSIARALDLPPYHKVLAAYEPAVSFFRRTTELAASAPAVQQRAYIRRPLVVLARTYLPLLGVALLCSAIVIGNRRLGASCGWLVAVVLLAYWYNLGICLETAIITVLEVSRYMTVQVICAIQVEFLTILLVIEVLVGFRRMTREIDCEP